MTTLLVLIGVIGMIGLFGTYLISAPPAKVAALLRMVVPLLVGLAGAVLSFTGRIGVGAPLLMFAFALWSRARRRIRSQPSQGQQSTVRSAMLEMMLDHDTGSMNGVVLAGTYEGRVLDDMDEPSLLALAKEIADDSESVQLLEAYLDRRIPEWRDNIDADIGAGRASAAQSGAMTEQEAYQILGIEPGASISEIRKAHRGLMQRMHPDVGGSAFLAQRINEAKDFLVRAHEGKS